MDESKADGWFDIPTGLEIREIVFRTEQNGGEYTSHSSIWFDVNVVAIKLVSTRDKGIKSCRQT